MDTFEITIQRSIGDLYPVVAEFNQAGQLPLRAEGAFRLEDRDRRDLRVHELAPRAYGTVLGQALFRETIRDAFMQARSQIETNLRILLVVEAPELKHMHWERLCGPIRAGRRYDFLALDQRMLYSLYLPSLTDRRFPAIGRRDLRALVLTANLPADNAFGLARFDEAATVAAVRQALGDIPHEVLSGQPDADGPPTLNELLSRITGAHYTLLHFVAHGWFRESDGETVLFLLDDAGDVAPVTASDFLDRLDRIQGARGLPHFVFLSTCESAAPKAEYEGALGGLAQRLVRDLGMPAVVAMTEKVSIATAEQLAGEFYGRLRRHGQPDQALVEASVSLAERGDVTVPALYTRLGGRPLFSDDLERELTEGEVAYGLNRLMSTLPERAPVMQTEISRLARLAWGQEDADRTVLGSAALAEAEHALAEINHYCEEILDLNFRALALGQEPPAYDSRPPFRGLFPFREDDQEFFFGREPLVRTLQSRLAEHNFLAVLGPSGSGKSSLVMAGLLPALRAGRPGLSVAYLTPASDPLPRLEAALAPVQGGEYVVVVDQFEELFTLTTEEQKRQAFLETLLPLTETTPVVVTMRADFWGEVASYPGLKAMMQARQELIGPMTTAELRSAMEQQAAKVGLRFEADLSHTILDEVKGEPGAMPLLQHALLELWHRRHGRWLKAAEYREGLGGVQQAIAKTAEKVYFEVDEKDRERMRDIFVRLTRVDTAAGGGEARDTRQRVGYQELVPAGDSPADLRPLVERLATVRLVVTSVNAVTGQEEVEVAHEALIQHWPRLRRWLDDNRDMLRLRETIRVAAREWENAPETERANFLIHRGARLEEIESLIQRDRMKLNQQEQAYVLACIRLREQERTREEEQRQKELAAARQLAAEAEARREAEARQAAEAEARAREQVEAAERLAQAAEAQRKAQEEAARQAEVRALEQAEAARREAAAAERLKRRNTILRVVVGLALLAMVIAVGGGIFGLVNAARADAERDRANEAKDEADAQRDLANEARAEAEANAVEADRQAEKAAASQREAEDSALEARRQAELATAQAALARSRQLAADSLVQLENGNVDLAQLLAIEAVRASETDEAFNSLRSALIRAGGTRLEVNHGQRVTVTAWDPDQARLLTAGVDRQVRVWSMDGGELLFSLTGHTDEISSAAWRPDGSQILTASADRTARVWDAADGAERLSLRHDDWVRRARWSADGSRILTASWDGTARVWDAASGAELLRLAHDENPVDEAAWNADESLLVTTSWDGRARVWDAASGAMVQEFVHSESTMIGLTASWSPGGDRLATAGRDSLVRIWDTAGGTPVTSLLHGDGLATVQIYQARWSSDGAQLLTAASDGRARVWDAASGDERIVLEHPFSGAVWRAVWNSDESLIVTAGDDGTARVWNARTGAEQLRIVNGSSVRWVALDQGETLLLSAGADGRVRVWAAVVAEDEQFVLHHAGRGRVLHVAWNGAGDRLLTATSGGAAWIWNAGSGQVLARLDHEGDAVNRAVWSPDERLVATAGDDGTVRVWDANTGEAQRQLVHDGPVHWVAWGADGARLLTADNAGTIRVWGDNDEEPVLWLTAHKGPATMASWSPDGRLILSAGRDGLARIWSADTGDLVLQISNHKGPLRQAAWSQDGSRIVTAGEDWSARIFDAASGEQLARYNHAGVVSSARFNADESRLLTTSEDGTARVWVVADSKEALRLRHSGFVRQAAWSQDESQILTASLDGTVRVWSVAGGEEQFALPHRLPVNDAAWSPDGAYIASAGFDGRARIFLSGKEAVLSYACEQVSRNMTEREWLRYMGADRPYTEAEARTCANRPLLAEVSRPAGVATGALPAYDGPGDLEGLAAYNEEFPGKVAGADGSVWAFSGSQGDLVNVIVSSVGDVDLVLELLDESGASLTGGPIDQGTDAEATGSLALPQTGHYFVRVTGFDGGTGDYLLVIESLGTIQVSAGGDALGGLEFGRRTRGSVTAAGPALWFFEAARGDRLDITVEPLDFDALFMILNEDGDLLEIDGQPVLVDESLGFEFLAGLEIPADGQYILLVNGFEGETGTFVLTAERSTAGEVATGDAGGPAAAFTYGETRSGTVAAGGQQRWTFNGNGGDVVEVVVLPNAGFDPVLSVESGAGVFVGQVDDFGDGEPERLVVSLPSAGQYAVVVAGYLGAPGGYNVTLRSGTGAATGPAGAGDTGDTGDGGTASGAGQSTSGNIAYGQRQTGHIGGVPSRWDFTGAAGDVVDIAVVPDGNLDAKIQLLDGSGRLIAEIDDGGTEDEEKLFAVLPAGGSFTIVIQGYNNTLGDYSVTLTLNATGGGGAAASTAGTIGYNQTVSGRVAGVPSRWTFEGAQGDQVEILATGLGFDVVLLVRNAAGQLIVREDEGGNNDTERAVLTLSATGTYTILVRGFQSSSGDFNLTLNQLGGG